MFEIHRCEVCGNDQLEKVLNLGAHPMCDDLVPVGDPRVCREYPIEILYCETCRTAHQRFQVPKQDLFPTTYHYRSRFTADVLSGMKQLVDDCVMRQGSLKGKRILDVGCNDGSLLGFFRDAGGVTFGIEPTGAAADARQKGHVVENDFLTPAVADRFAKQHGQPHMIVFTNVFAHIENLGEVLDSLRRLMSHETLLVIENHYLGGVVAGRQFDTFYHEHPRTYSCSSFVAIAKTLGMNLIDVAFPSRYGGNIRVVLGKQAATDSLALADVLAREEQFGAKLKAMQSEIHRWKLAKSHEIGKQVRKYGQLHAKAFPGRAAILVKLLELDADEIDCVYEKPGSMKIGHYLPGTRIPICSDDDFPSLEREPPVLLNLAWHISTEIRSYLSQRGYHGDVIDILAPQDFKAVA